MNGCQDLVKLIQTLKIICNCRPWMSHIQHFAESVVTVAFGRLEWRRLYVYWSQCCAEASIDVCNLGVGLRIRPHASRFSVFDDQRVTAP